MPREILQPTMHGSMADSSAILRTLVTDLQSEKDGTMSQRVETIGSQYDTRTIAKRTALYEETPSQPSRPEASNCQAD
jgi:hypothetical protein